MQQHCCLMPQDHKDIAMSKLMAIGSVVTVSCPEGLTLRRSETSDSGYTVWSTHVLPKGTMFGPLSAKTCVKEEPGETKVRTEKSDVTDVNPQDGAATKWMHFVNSTCSHSDQNLVAVNYNEEIFYKTTATVPPGTELKVGNIENVATKNHPTSTAQQHNGAVKIEPGSSETSGKKTVACCLCKKSFTTESKIHDMTKQGNIMRTLFLCKSCSGKVITKKLIPAGRTPQPQVKIKQEKDVEADCDRTPVIQIVPKPQTETNETISNPDLNCATSDQPNIHPKETDEEMKLPERTVTSQKDTNEDRPHSYTCIVCKKGFDMAVNLSVHMLRHRREGWYPGKVTELVPTDNAQNGMQNESVDNNRMDVNIPVAPSSNPNFTLFDMTRPIVNISPTNLLSSSASNVPNTLQVTFDLSLVNQSNIIQAISDATWNDSNCDKPSSNTSALLNDSSMELVEIAPEPAADMLNCSDLALEQFKTLMAGAVKGDRRTLRNYDNEDDTGSETTDDSEEYEEDYEEDTAEVSTAEDDTLDIKQDNIVLDIKPVDRNIKEKGPIDRQYSCGICGRKFIHMSSVHYHMNSHYKSGTISSSVCRICGKGFVKESALMNHMKVHKKTYPCNACPKVFKDQSELQEHTGKHKVFCCKVCRKKFNKEERLIVHMRTHNGDKPFTCVICSRGFTQKSNLVTHLRVHSNERPYPCPTCGRGFKLSQDLTRHERTHRDERRYVCTKCPKRFSRLDQLKRHLKIHSCNLCGKEFPKRKDLFAHIKSHVQVTA